MLLLSINDDAIQINNILHREYFLQQTEIQGDYGLFTEIRPCLRQNCRINRTVWHLFLFVLLDSQKIMSRRCYNATPYEFVIHWMFL